MMFPSIAKERERAKGPREKGRDEVDGGLKVVDLFIAMEVVFHEDLFPQIFLGSTGRREVTGPTIKVPDLPGQVVIQVLVDVIQRVRPRRPGGTFLVVRLILISILFSLLSIRLIFIFINLDFLFAIHDPLDLPYQLSRQRGSFRSLIIRWDPACAGREEIEPFLNAGLVRLVVIVGIELS